MNDLYKQVQQKAFDFLIQNNISKLPYNLSSICKQYSIKIFADNDNKVLSPNTKGLVFFSGGFFNIIINKQYSIQEQRYTLAHELGHILLRHIKTSSDENLQHFDIGVAMKSPMEYQAEMFAIDILAPLCILWETKVETADDIMRLCNIPYSTADFRAGQIALLKDSKQVIFSKKEHQICKQFNGFIQDNT